MENSTLDSIRPSENPQEEMSYPSGRDPNNENVSERSESQTLQTYKVYLRLKPFQKKLKLTEEQQEAYKIENSTTLTLTKRSKNNETVHQKFTFSETFGPETTQLELFKKTVQEQMANFLNGQTYNLMAYGKKYILQNTI